MKTKSLQNYTIGSEICNNIMNELVSKIKDDNILDIKELENFGDNRINEECMKIYDDKNKNKNKLGVAYPTSISLNNCVGNYLYSEGDVIKNGDIVKIEIGVNIYGCIVNLGETIIYNGCDEPNKYLELLDILKNDIINIIKHGENNDEMRIHIESKCLDYNCFPVENCISYQHLDNQCKTEESKYMILNYTDIDNDNYNDNINCLENICFEFNEGEVYTINLKIIPNNMNNADETKHKYYKLDEPHIYRFNDYYYDFKLRSSREFSSAMKKKYDTNAFNFLQYKNNKTYRLGIKECLKRELLESYPILYSRDKLPIYHKIFTIIIGKDTL